MPQHALARFGFGLAVVAVSGAGCGGSGSPGPPEPPPPPVVVQPNAAPAANAGADQSVEAGSTVTLDGSGSSDPDGDALEYSWRQTEGRRVELAAAATATATFPAPEVEWSETLSFELEVNDGRGGTDTDETRVTVGPAAVSVCDRTPQVRDEIVRRAGASDCGAVYLSKVGRIDLVGKGIDRLQAGDFAGLHNAISVDLSRNLLTELPDGVFRGLSYALSLDVAHNELATVPAGVFDGTSPLTLGLDYNEIATLPVGVFEGLTRTEFLTLEGHRLGVVPAGMFRGLDSLTSLWFGGEGDVEIGPGVFDGLPTLENLRLGTAFGTSSLTLRAGAFAAVPKLQTISLRRAGLRELPAELFADVPLLRSLTISRNLHLTALPDGLFDGLTVLEDLDLQKNTLRSLPDRPFSDLNSLKWLSLHNNNITRLADGVFEGLTVIEEFDIRANHGGNFFQFQDGFSVRVELERVDGDPGDPSPARLRVRVPTGVPYELTTTVDVQNGTPRRVEAVVPRGGSYSEEFEVTADGGTATHVSVRLRRATPGVRIRGIGLQAEPALVLFGTTPNRPPSPVGVPAPHVVTADVGVSRVSNVAAYFDDPDDDRIEVTATSSDRDVVEATVSDGVLEFRSRGEGSATVTLTATDPDGLRAWQDVPLTVEPGPDPDGFDIALVVLNPHYEMHNEEIARAANHLSTVVVGDLPDADYSVVAADPLASWPEVFMGTLDDVRVLVDVGRVAHSGGGFTWRDSSYTTLVGGIGINVLENDPDRLFNVGLHEMMHVLGIGQGPLWGRWLRNPVYRPDGAVVPADTHFPGALAIEAFDEAGGSAYAGAKVPVDNDPSRSQSHWRPSMMSRELMSPWGVVLSAITIQALADMGYVVDVSRAEPFEITLPTAESSQGSVPGVFARLDSSTGTRPFGDGRDGSLWDCVAEACINCWTGLDLRRLGGNRPADEERPLR